MKIPPDFLIGPNLTLAQFEARQASLGRPIFHPPVPPKTKARLAHANEWQVVLAVFGEFCLRCGSPEITRDHIVPRSRGGKNDRWNLQPLCGECNRLKGSLVRDYRDPSLLHRLGRPPEPILEVPA
jgi:5-methylcytosine-specific restriction endonuclease McrA